MWIKAKHQQPDPALGCVVYRLRKPGREQWFCGIAYFTVSGKWKPDTTSAERSLWGELDPKTLEWMELPE